MPTHPSVKVFNMVLSPENIALGQAYKVVKNLDRFLSFFLLSKVNIEQSECSVFLIRSP